MIFKNGIIALLFLSKVGFSQTTYIPDNNFEQALIDLGLDDVLDNYVLTENIDTVLEIQLVEKNIDNLIGIEDFSSLVFLNAAHNNLTELDISNNFNLEYLWCNYNKIEELNLYASNTLKVVLCEENELTTLNIVGCTSLETLICGENQLTELNLAGTNLNGINCKDNMIETLDLSEVTGLVYFDCSENNISELDMTYSTNLKFFFCQFNTIEELDLSNCSELKRLNCSNNNLELLNLTNVNCNVLLMEFYNVSENPNLFCVQVDDVICANNEWINKDNHTIYNESCGLGIEDSKTALVKIYPNPAKDYIIIEASNNNGTYTIVDVFGKVIKTGMLNRGKNTIQINYLSTGIYFIQLKSENLNSTHKISVK